MSLNDNESDSISEQPSSQSESLLSQTSMSSATPKGNEKKARARAMSESSSSPSANKVAKMSPRATRSSQNPDFAAKQRKFLNRVHDPIRRDNSDSDNSQGAITPVSSKTLKETKSRSVERKSMNDGKKKDSTPKRSADTDEEGSPKKKRTKEPTKVVGGVDSYCWRCHRDGNVIRCGSCPRVYHLKCVQIETAPPKGWMCPECSTVMRAENTDTRSRAMKMLTVDQLCNLLRFALNRMKNHEGSEDFAKPVDVAAFPYYREYIVKPMDLTQLERNMKAKMYGSTEGFLADAKWIVHNSIIFNSVQSKFTNTARALLKICRQEMQEIENCPDCYQNAHTRSSDSWFIEACRRPHLLVWAKLKGFPFWPAKAMSTNNDNLVDVRFFGAHDRAWVPVNQCFLYSKLSPAPSSVKNKRNLEECLQELEYHIKKLKDKFGQFEYAPYKTPYDPKNESIQLAMLLPRYEAKEPGKRNVRISLHQDGARRSFVQPKASPATIEKLVTDSPAKSSSSNKGPLQPKALLAVSKPPSSESVPAGQKVLTPPMVIFPGKTKQANQLPVTALVAPATSPNKMAPETQGIPEEETEKKSLEDQLVAPGKNGTPEGLKKSYKTPLTAAAKKCFATKDKSCIKCHTQTSAAWHPGQSGELLCATCSSSSEKEVAEHIEFKKDDRGDDADSTIRGTVTLPRKNPEEQVDSELLPNELHSREHESDGIEKPIESSPDESTVASVDDGAGGDNEEESVQEEEGLHVPTAAGEASTLEFATVDSPPKFIIPKVCGGDTSETSKKVSIVDRLQEKLCFAVEEAIKDHLPPLEENDSIVEEPIGHNVDEIIESNIEESETLVEKDNNETPAKTGEKLVMQVLLHDLKNDKEIMDKLRESEMKQTENKVSADGELETQSLSETSSEPDTEISINIESDNPATDEENNKKKKQNNINNVVKTLKERKSSVDEKSEQGNKIPRAKESTPVILEDFNDESQVLIIDESEYNSSESRTSPSKPDKNRRKGIPAKVCSRSSTSTESSETSPEQTSKSRCVTEVLDEVSGKFRRSSGESNVTITLVTDDTTPQKKTPKEIRSVNISKSLSLSVINESSASLEMECVESNLDDQVNVDTVVKKVPPRPTARKTLPNPQKILDLPNTLEKSITSAPSRGSELEAAKLHPVQTLLDPSTPPPPLINLRQQTKTYGPSRVQNGGVQQIGSRPIPHRTATTSSPRTELGSANAQIEEAVNKMSGQLRCVIEEMLRGMSESGATEATVKALQVEMERLQWRHRQELAELKHNTDLLVMEMRASLEAEKQRALLDAKHKHEIEKEQAIQETKRKQWCAYCQKEAQLYCCWNTAYCSYSCQQSHWMPHMTSCLNKQQGTNAEGTSRATQPPQQPRPSYNLPPGQRMRQQMMPPPVNPPPYHQTYRPNQVYTAMPPRFPPTPRPPSHMYPVDPLYPRVLQ